jgi:hypothetical protein
MYDVVATKQDAATICLHGKRIPRDFVPVDMAEVMAISLKAFTTDGAVNERDCETEWVMKRRKK